MTNPTKNVDVPAYVEAMKTKSFTENWDVAITYSQAAINDLLVQRFNGLDHGMTTTVTFSIATEDHDGKFTQSYEFTLGSPLIQFQSTGNSPSCSLQTKITNGKFWRVDNSGSGSINDIPANAYTISIGNIDLGLVTGSTDVTTGANDTVVFPDGDVNASHIVLDLPTSNNLVITVNHPSIPSPPIPMKDENLPAALKDFFTINISAIKYTLAIINNAPPPGTLDLAPRSFRFAAMQVSDTQSYLTVFIQTQSSGKRGNTKDLQSHWTSNWSKAGVNPVPKDHSASIIINNSFFVSAFINPALAVHSAAGVPELIQNDLQGIHINGTWPQSTRGDLDYQHTGFPADEDFRSLHMSSAHVDPNVGGAGLKITFSQSNGTNRPATTNFNWSYSFNNGWDGVFQWLEQIGGDDAHPKFATRRENRNGAVSVACSIDLTQDFTTISNESFAINVRLNRGDWRIIVDGDSADSVKDLFGPRVDGVVQIDINFGPLRFFPLINMLLPGKNVIDVDTTAGIRIPRDVIMVGNILSQTSGG